MQLDLFSNQEFQALNYNFEKCKDSSDRVRRCVFGKLDEVKKTVDMKIIAQDQKIEAMNRKLDELLSMQPPSLKEYIG